MKLILTGAAGFIGMNVLERLSKDNKYDFIYSVDKMGYATEYNRTKYYELCANTKNVFPIACDINDVEKLKVISDISKHNLLDLDILDFASESHVDNSIKDPFSIFTQNASIPANILSWIGKENWGKIHTYYHISTDEIYGQLPLDSIRLFANWFKTTDPIKPNNPYSASKAAQDCFLMAMRHTFKIPVKFIRMANQMPGKYQHPEKMLPASILRVIKGETIKVYGQGLNIRQWTPVDITADIIVDILNEKIKFDDVIHIAHRYGVYNNNQITDMIIETMNALGYDAKKEYIVDRLGHDSAYALDTLPEIDKYFDNVNFKAYLKKTAEYYIQNRDIFIKNTP